MLPAFFAGGQSRTDGAVAASPDMYELVTSGVGSVTKASRMNIVPQNEDRSLVLLVVCSFENFRHLCFSILKISCSSI